MVSAGVVNATSGAVREAMEAIKSQQGINAVSPFSWTGNPGYERPVTHMKDAALGALSGLWESIGSILEGDGTARASQDIKQEYWKHSIYPHPEVRKYADMIGVAQRHNIEDGWKATGTHGG
jgi:hypothetical protein